MDTMNFRRCAGYAGVFLSCLVAEASAAPPDSVYADITPARCVTQSVNEAVGASTQLCEGVGGYRLRVEDFDGRQTVAVIRPDKSVHPLEYGRVITSGFATLGAKSEWRVERRDGKLIPFALIIRVNASENPEAPGRKTSYLAVARLGQDRICVTDRIRASATMNEEARRAADGSAAKPCL